jgi:hypothetical protein
MDGADAELALDRGTLLLDVLRRAEAIDEDVGALLGHRSGIGEADAAGGSGDDCGLRFEDHGSLPRWGPGSI